MAAATSMEDHHEVTATDTLASVAARYDTLPSKLAALNKLGSSRSFIFPGMKLKIPPPEPSNDSDSDPEIVDDQFVRVNVRCVHGDGDLVRGGLLLTPKVVTFTPSAKAASGRDPDALQLVLPADLVAHYGVVDDDRFRLTMGKPLGKKLPRSAPLVSFGEQKLEPRYEFVVAHGEKMAALAEFVKRVHPGFKSAEGGADAEALGKNGMELVEEAVRVSEEHLAPSFDFEVFGDSEVLDEDSRLWLSGNLPPRAFGHNWVLKFATSSDGFSLGSMSRRLSSVGGPVALVVSACDGAAFGALLSEAPSLAASERFQGTGETFVFTLEPRRRAFRWTGANSYFFRLDAGCLVVGSGDGSSALWLDADLNQGRTRPCTTFDSPPLSQEDFTVKALECWAFEM